MATFSTPPSKIVPRPHKTSSTKRSTVLHPELLQSSPSPLPFQPDLSLPNSPTNELYPSKRLSALLLVLDTYSSRSSPLRNPQTSCAICATPLSLIGDLNAHTESCLNEIYTTTSIQIVITAAPVRDTPVRQSPDQLDKRWLYAPKLGSESVFRDDYRWVNKALQAQRNKELRAWLARRRKQKEQEEQEERKIAEPTDRASEGRRICTREMRMTVQEWRATMQTQLDNVPAPKITAFSRASTCHLGPSYLG